MTIVQQLVDIYLNEEFWHKFHMSYLDAIKYHTKRIENGDIWVCQENGKVLGYYERSFSGDTCFLKNVYIDKEHRRGRVFIELYKHFFRTMPDNIKYIVGEDQHLGGQVKKVQITKERRNGKHES